jgi:hypothetical protein
MFTAKYKLEILAAYDAAPDGEKVRCCVGRACTPATSCSGGGPATPAHWLGWPFRADVSGATRS